MIVAGRAPVAADEIVVDQNAERELHLEIGSTLVFEQDAPAKQVAELPPGMAPRQGDLSFTARLRVVGISKSVSDGVNWNIGSAFYDAHKDELIGPTNIFVDLRDGQKKCVSSCPAAVVDRFQRDVQRITGLPINVENFLEGTKKTQDTMRLERDGLLLFALAVLIGGGALVGQALVRSVTGGVGDLPTWRAMGAGRRVLVRALVIPTLLHRGRRCGDRGGDGDPAVAALSDRSGAQVRPRPRHARRLAGDRARHRRSRRRRARDALGSPREWRVVRGERGRDAPVGGGRLGVAHRSAGRRWRSARGSPSNPARDGARFRCDPR